MLKMFMRILKKIYYKLICPSKRHFRYYLDYSYFSEGGSFKISFKDAIVEVAPLSKMLCRDEFINILCSGPSLRSITRMEKLFSHPTLVMNGSHMFYEGTDSVFDYYVVSDIGFVRRNWDLFIKGLQKSKNLLFDHRVIAEALQVDSSVFNGKNVYVYDLFKRPYNRKIKNGKTVFSLNSSDGFNSSKTVAFLALQLAASIGYKNIHFFGLDLNNKLRFYSEKNPEKSMIDEDFLDILEDFQHAAEICKDRDISVVNASPESRLPEEIFPKIDPNEILDGMPGD